MRGMRLTPSKTKAMVLQGAAKDMPKFRMGIRRVIQYTHKCLLWYSNHYRMQFISSICHLTRACACPALVELPSVAIMPWSGVHRGFVVRTFFENNHSIVATQRAFRLHFNIPRHGLIPDS